jgi:transposase
MSQSILGIDVAKDSLQATLLHQGKTYRRGFVNQPAQFHVLDTWLDKHAVRELHACLEATGRYGEAVAEHLYQRGYTVSVVNPARIKGYATSQLARNKTDALDADLIADFCQTQHPPAWVPPAAEIRELQEFAHRYDVLQQARQQEVNRLQAGLRAEAVRAQTQAHLDFLDQQIEQLKQIIHDHIQRHPDLKARQALLTSIPGIGELTAAKLQTLELHRFADARAATAFVGLNPMIRTSGKSVHRRPRLSKMGDASWRKCLYLPAVSAKRWNPIIAEFCARLEERDKSTMAIIGAAMRKLLCLAYGVLKSGKPFDPNYLRSTQVTS